MPVASFDQFSMLIAGAVASLGVALLPRYMIENELAGKKLVQLSDISLRTKNGYFLVTAAGSHSPHVKAFSKWIKSVAAK